MNLFNQIIILFFLTGSSFILIAKEEGLKSISKKELKTHLEFIASDSLQGRNFGTTVPGLDMAARYLALSSKKMGLKPFGSSFFQPVGIIKSEPDPQKSIIKLGRNDEGIIFSTDSVTCLYRGEASKNFKGEVIFAGFGWHNKKSGYDDLEKVDIRDKIVIFLIGTPDSFLEESEGKNGRYNNQLEKEKMERAINKGARGVILVTSPFDETNKSFNNIRKWMSRPGYSLKGEEANNFVLTTSTILNRIFGNRINTIEVIKDCVKRADPVLMPGSGFFVDVVISRKEVHFEGQNVIGIVEGSDSLLKKECVVFMAHYDHLGVNSRGEIFNGADDNGSGTVTLLEVAEAFMSLKEKPKRSIVFLWVTAEEIGMLGSEYYIQNPVFPLENTLASINLDMVGRVFERRDTIWKKSPKLVKGEKGLFTLSGNNCPELVKISDAACKRIGINPDKSLPPAFLRSSDHYHFYNKGVPILNYATGYHADYHKVSDEVSKINYKKMKKVAELCFLVGYEVANCETLKKGIL